jgi:sulfonate transport system substrate-binding protein
LKRFLWVLLAAAVLAAGGRLWAGPQDLAVTLCEGSPETCLHLGEAAGLFDKAFAPQGIRRDLPELLGDPRQTQGLAAGSVQVAHCLGGTSPCGLAAAGGVDLKIVGIYSRGLGPS